MRVNKPWITCAGRERPLGRSSRKLEDNTKVYLKNIYDESVDLIHLAQCRRSQRQDQGNEPSDWWLYKTENFLTS
jgi:hypothetical protein